MFYSFGHVLNNIEQNGAILVDPKILGWLYLAILLISILIVIRANIPQNLTKFLNYVSFVALIFPLSSILFFKFPILQFGQESTDAFARLRAENQAERNLPVLPAAELPDIYYIIFDSYERADKLLAYYNYDNSEFITELRHRGFYIVEESRSNYLNTSYSLNTSLNLIYVHELPLKPFFETLSNLEHNHVSAFLREQGYQIVVFQSGTGDTDKQYADVFIESEVEGERKSRPINPFEQFLLKTSLARLFFVKSDDASSENLNSNVFITSVNRQLDTRREIISHAFANLPNYADQMGNYFLFSHIYLPHIPFLYGPNAEPLQYEENLSTYWYEPPPENYHEHYGYQIDYLNQEILDTVDHILSQTKKPVVIILQADHGDGNYIDQNGLSQIGVDTRSAIFNAIYFSDGDYTQLYPTLTPVNTFRIVFNHWFGTQYPLVPDKVFANEHPSKIRPNTRPKFWDACLAYEICVSTNQD